MSDFARSFWGLYLAPQVLHTREQVLEYVRLTQPYWFLVLNDVQWARDIKKASPNTHVIVRLFMPDGYWYGKSQESYLQFYDDNKVDDNLWCFVENEAGINQAWNTRLMDVNRLRQNPRHLVICNLSVGTPADPSKTITQIWKDNATLLRYLDTYREYLVLGLHEYWNVDWQSGFFGGWPDNAGVAPNPYAAPGSIGKNLIPVENWLTPAQAKGVTKFHCGRFEFLNQACKELGIKPPRIVLTEHGQDDVSDIKQFVELKVGQGIRGWRTLNNWYQKTYKEWAVDRTYFEMFRHARDVIYAGTNVEGALPYMYGNNGDPTWQQFNLEYSGVLERFQAIAAAPYNPPPPPIVIPPPVTPPVPKLADVHITLKDVPYEVAVQLPKNLTIEIVEKKGS